MFMNITINVLSIALMVHFSMKKVFYAMMTILWKIVLILILIKVQKKKLL